MVFGSEMTARARVSKSSADGIWKEDVLSVILDPDPYLPYTVGGVLWLV